jgi:hypothetical protein
MPYMTRLITITQYENITQELRPFVEFQAAQKKLELKSDTLVALLQVEDIPSYHTIFLDSGISFDEILKELENQELMLNEDTKKTLLQVLQNRQKK